MLKIVTVSQTMLTGYQLMATCDNTLKVFLDGQLQAAPQTELDDWRLTSTFPVPEGDNTIIEYQSVIDIDIIEYMNFLSCMYSTSSWIYNDSLKSWFLSQCDDIAIPY